MGKRDTGMGRGLWATRGSLDRLMKGRANGFGLIRLVLAVSVVISHANPLGFHRDDVGTRFSGSQTNLGTVAVIGFFVISGYVITGSAKRLSVGRYAWHRALRILPGMWTCVLFTAFALAPVLYHHEHHTLTGFHLHDPLDYVAAMWNVSNDGGDIARVLATGMHHHTNFNVNFNGALWSLRYEVLCYIVIGVLAAGGTLLRARRTVPLVAGCLWILMIMNLWDAPSLRAAPNEPYTWLQLPLLGGMDTHFVIYLGFTFLLGSTMELYRERIPVNDLLALACAALLLGSLRYGAFYVVGCPAFAYLLIWAGVRTPRQLHWVGRRNDHSYGLYIYGFLVEQTLSLLGFAHRGRIVYTLLAVAVTWVLAWLSWHLVEKQAMRLKGWTPGRPTDRPVPPQPEPTRSLETSSVA
ncbi:acyltransferase family protein [Streptacidiphilus rugosus]|uniref:acyltransferase family protein n=1 Tax=Streptacidiphilus rugosus TaxID=405783 RepID=UPI0006918DF3|nr:acyltransferase [Streptacidiphilus rugosus]